MGSTGEPDRKRRHINSISSAVAAPAMKGLSSPCSEDRKLDAVVLQFQNQKLVQQLEAQRVEHSLLESKIEEKKKRQNLCDEMLVAVQHSWQKLVDDLESFPSTGSSQCPENLDVEDEFLSRLIQSGATDCSGYAEATQMDCNRTIQDLVRHILQNVVFEITALSSANDQLSGVLSNLSLEDGLNSQLRERIIQLQTEVRNLQDVLKNLHIKHRLLSSEVQIQRDTQAKHAAEKKLLEGELDNACIELKECKTQVASLKAMKDNGKHTPFLFPTFGTNHLVGDKARDKDKEFHDLQFHLKELMDMASDRFTEIIRLHEKRIEDLRRLSILQNTLTDLRLISSSQAFMSLSDQLERSKNEMNLYQLSLEELQAEKDNCAWKDKEVTMKLDIADVSKGALAVVESRIMELQRSLQNLEKERVLLECKLEEVSQEPGRHEIISDFKALVSTLPKDMNTIQSQMNKYKEDSYEIHSIRAKVRSLSNVLNRKEEELEILSSRSASQINEVKRLEALVQDLRKSDGELKLFLEMYRRECTDSPDVVERKEMEYRAWAHLQSLQSSLDEHSLELRVKAANEAEAIAQKRLATAEAEIAELRQKFEDSEKDFVHLSNVLESKREEGESYLSEIESIGHAYEDVQNKNQHLLQEITDRDDYNIKLAVDGVKARQLKDAMHMEIQNGNWEIQQAKSAADASSQTSTILDEQLEVWSEQVAKLSADKWQSSVALENTKRRLTDVERESQQLRKRLNDLQHNIDVSRHVVSDLQIELEKERFNKKRVEEDLEMMTRKATCLRTDTEGSSVLGKLKQELREYKGILKCGICNDRQKEVVIAKCYHLFCHPCIRRTLESRHRRCPTCSSTFGPNDVKPIYI